MTDRAPKPAQLRDRGRFWSAASNAPSGIERNPLVRAWLAALPSADDEQIIEFCLRFFPEVILPDPVELTAAELREWLARTSDVLALSNAASWMDAVAIDRVRHNGSVVVCEIRQRVMAELEKRQAALGKPLPDLVRDDAGLSSSLEADAAIHGPGPV